MVRHYKIFVNILKTVRNDRLDRVLLSVNNTRLHCGVNFAHIHRSRVCSKSFECLNIIVTLRNTDLHVLHISKAVDLDVAGDDTRASRKCVDDLAVSLINTLLDVTLTKVCLHEFRVLVEIVKQIRKA